LDSLGIITDEKALVSWSDDDSDDNKAEGTKGREEEVSTPK